MLPVQLVPKQPRERLSLTLLSATAGKTPGARNHGHQLVHFDRAGVRQPLHVECSADPEHVSQGKVSIGSWSVTLKG